MDDKPYIKITPKPGVMGLDYMINVLFRKDGDYYAFFIPSLDIMFTADSIEQGEEYVVKLSESFFYYWLNKGPKRFFTHINALGFRVASGRHLTTMSSLMKGDRRTPATFESSRPISLPSDILAGLSGVSRQGALQISAG